jgi:hypothetical protein
MIVVNGVNHYQLTDSATGEPQVKTELQRAADNWPPVDGVACDKSPDKKVVSGDNEAA